MKKNIFLGLALATFVSINTFAQAPAQAPAAQPAGKMMQHPASEQHPMAPAAERAQKATDRLTKSLGLDAATATKVHDILMTRDTKIDALIAAGGKDQAAFKANKESFETAMKGVLTADQFAKFSAMEGHRKGDKADKAKQ